MYGRMDRPDFQFSRSSPGDGSKIEWRSCTQLEMETVKYMRLTLKIMLAKVKSDTTSHKRWTGKTPTQTWIHWIAAHISLCCLAEFVIITVDGYHSYYAHAIDGCANNWLTDGKVQLFFSWLRRPLSSIWHRCITHNSLSFQVGWCPAILSLIRLHSFKGELNVN